MSRESPRWACHQEEAGSTANKKVAMAAGREGADKWEAGAVVQEERTGSRGRLNAAAEEDRQTLAANSRRCADFAVRSVQAHTAALDMSAKEERSAAEAELAIALEAQAMEPEELLNAVAEIQVE